MADNPSERGPQDRARVNLDQDYERRWWSKKWGVSEDELVRTVNEVGNSVDAVARRLGKAER